MKKTILLFYTLLVAVGGLFSQTLDIGVFGGGAYYLGDINPAGHFQQSKPAIGFISRYNINDIWAIRLSAVTGKLRGDDAISKVVENRNLKFNSPITDISSVMEFNFFSFSSENSKYDFSPYIFGGVSLFFFNPQDGGYVLRNLFTEGQIKGYNLRGVSIPFGAGFKYGLSEKIDIGIEWGMRKTFTDYIDDISTTYYVDEPWSAPFSDPTGMHLTGEQRGNPKTKDWFSFFGLSITMQFDLKKNTDCAN